MNDILKLIKTRCSIRKYKEKPIPKKEIDQIIEAGIWGPSLTTFLKIQPWKFTVVLDKKKILAIGDLLIKKANNSNIYVKILLNSSAKIIMNAASIIVIYSSDDIEIVKYKYKEFYIQLAKLGHIAEISAISAAIQNMILIAESLGIGSCWLDTPLFCEKEINKMLNNTSRLLALLTLGYPNEKGKRSKRKKRSETVSYL